MKTAVIPQVRVEPELRADLDSVLLPGETVSDFAEASVRRAVEFRRVQTDFAARCDASLAEYERTGVSVPSDVVLSKLEAKVATRVKQLQLEACGQVPRNRTPDQGDEGVRRERLLLRALAAHLQPVTPASVTTRKPASTPSTRVSTKARSTAVVTYLVLSASSRS